MDVEQPNAARNASERLMLGLRLLDGIALKDVDAILRESGQEVVLRAAIDTHINDGLLAETHGRLHLTQRGIFLADTVITAMI